MVEVEKVFAAAHDLAAFDQSPARPAWAANSVIDACGSKFLVGVRSARYQRLSTTLHPANILWYYEDDENASEGEGWDPDNLEPLLKVGHSITRARDAQEL